MDTLWKYENYQTSKPLIPNTSIIEYDLKSANISVAKEFGLLPYDMIEDLSKVDKKTREVKVGLYKRDHKEYNDLEKAAFMQARKMFFDQNELTPDRIVSIKKDAIFVSGRVTKTKLTPNIDFRPKNEYTSYLMLKPVEVYYVGGAKAHLDVKKINDEVYLTKHANYFGTFIVDFLRRLELAEKKDILRFVRDFYDQYRWMMLEPDYYREFNAMSYYLYKDGSKYDICIDKDDLNIEYNLKLILFIMELLL